MLSSNSVGWLKTQCQADELKINQVLDLEPDKIDNPMSTLNMILGYPLKTQCLTSFSIGGRWKGKKGWDGNKLVCLDNFPKMDYSKDCLIYSFGLNRDWSFEQEMAKIGCEVHGYDHTINLPQLKTKQENGFYTWDRGVGNVTKGKLTTLQDAFKVNGHEDRTINYLKVDIEMNEVEAIPEWISSGALKNVDQIGIEVHISERGTPQFFLQALKDLYQMGFRLIAWYPNLVHMIDDRPCCAEIVLKKNVSNFCDDL